MEITVSSASQTQSGNCDVLLEIGYFNYDILMGIKCLWVADSKY